MAASPRGVVDGVKCGPTKPLKFTHCKSQRQLSVEDLPTTTQGRRGGGCANGPKEVSTSIQWGGKGPPTICEMGRETFVGGGKEQGRAMTHVCFTIDIGPQILRNSVQRSKHTGWKIPVTHTKWYASLPHVNHRSKHFKVLGCGEYLLTSPRTIP